MAANSLLATATQALGVIAYRGDDGVTAAMVARSLKTNPVVVRRLLKDLERAGLVTLRQGRNGGVRLNVKPDKISLADINAAVNGESELFALRAQANPNCPISKAMGQHLPSVFSAASDAATATLRRTRLSSLLADARTR